MLTGSISKHSVLFMLLILLSLSFDSSADIRIGVNSHNINSKTIARWEPIGAYLSKELGEPVKVIPFKVAHLLEAANKDVVDFMFANPMQSVILREKYGATLLASVAKSHTGPQFAGLIIARKDSNIKTLEDMRGKKALSMEFRVAAGGYLFQAYHMRQKGIDIHDNFFSSFWEAVTQPGIALAVHKKIVDIGFVRTGILESLEKEGKVKMEDFTIIDQSLDDYPLPHTTRLYPDWYFSAMPATDEVLSHKVKDALLSLSPEHESAVQSRIDGFVEPLPMDVLIEVLKAFKIDPFDK